MSELQSPDGTPIDVSAGEAAFAAAMGADNSDVPAPPRMTPEEKAARTAEQPKRGRGRPPKNERARTAPSVIKGEVLKDDYTADAESTVSTVFTLAAILPPTQVLAYTILQSSEALAKGLAEGAKHDATIRKIVSQGGEAGWKMQLAAVGIQMGIATLAIMRDPEAKEKATQVVKQTLSDMAPKPETPPESDSDGASAASEG